MTTTTMMMAAEAVAVAAGQPVAVAVAEGYVTAAPHHGISQDQVLEDGEVFGTALGEAIVMRMERESQ